MNTIALSLHESEVNSLKSEIIALTEENRELKTGMSEEYSQLNFRMKLCKQLALTAKMSPEDLFFLSTAGAELGMSVMQSIKSMYIVNGRASFYGQGLAARLTSQGIRLSYTNETENGVTVVSIDREGNICEEIVTDKDQILRNSKVMSFAKKNKMRHHGVKMIALFYYPHLLGSVGVWEKDDYEDDYEAIEEAKKPDNYIEVKELIAKCETKEELTELHAKHKATITKSLDLLNAYGAKKKELI